MQAILSLCAQLVPLKSQMLRGKQVIRPPFARAKAHSGSQVLLFPSPTLPFVTGLEALSFLVTFGAEIRSHLGSPG